VLPETYTPGEIQFDVIDVSGDGKKDIVFGLSDLEGTRSFHLSIQSQDGSFSNPLEIAEITDPTGTFSDSENYFYTLRDADGDGDTDLIAMGWENGEWHLLLFENNGAATFTSQGPLFNLNPAVTTALTGDGNNDGTEDLLISQGTQWLLSPGLPGGGFGATQPMTALCCAESEILFGDLNGDGLEDYMTLNDASLVQVFIAQGNGLYIQNNTYVVTGVINWYPEGKSMLSDVDGDGDLDLITFETLSMRWLENQGGGFFGDSDGDQMPVLHPIAATTFTSSILLGDVADADGDGDADILGDNRLGNEWTPRNYWYENNGEGIYVPRPFNSPAIPTGMRITDLDGDGDQDYVAFGYDLATPIVWWLRNTTNEGCTNPSACNYDPAHTIDDGSCCFGTCGCPDNDPLANCDDGSCEYTQPGFVYHDLNQNTIWDAGEPPIANHRVVVYPDNLVVFTNNEGAFTLTLPWDSYQFSVNLTEGFPTAVTPGSVIQLVYPFSQPIYFGLSDVPVPIDAGVGVISSQSFAPCDSWTVLQLCAHNGFNAELDFVISFTPDELYQEIQYGIAPDSIIGQTAWFSINSLHPGGMECIPIYALLPTVDFINEDLVSTGEFFVYINDDLLLADSYSFTWWNLCAYDPNDKLPEPNGYSEEHYVFDATEIEYKIRFQNTGSAPAFDVIVTDTLDPHFDLDTFEWLGSSHDAIVEFETDSGLLTFRFEDIMLPDSTTEPLLSQGFLRFKIRLKDNLSPNTPVYNTGYIYFDNNPPIITNTTWHTIFDCTLFNPEIELQDGVMWVDEGIAYQWYANGIPVPDATANSFTPDQPGTYYALVTHPMGCEVQTPSQEIVHVDERAALSLFQVFPQPSDGQLTIRAAHGNQIREIFLFALTGQEIAHYRNLQESDIIMSVADISSGIYLMRIIDEKGFAFNRTVMFR
jgi:hypothetical protein